MEKDRERKEATLEESGALEVRQRSRRGVNSLEKREVVEAGGEGEQRSVYYAKEQGVQITAETALMKLYNEDQFSAVKDIANVQVDFRTKEFHGREDILVREANNTLKNTNVENGSNSQHYSEGYNENEITDGQHEIDRYKEIKTVKKSELKVSDVDLERVLEEQDTHDLFCPNCSSCITRRVILRKRERSDEMPDLDDREPDVFGCLSCFSFFIPTEGGFNIFRIFKNKEENRNLPSSQQIPEEKINWILSIFKSGTSKRKESEPETPKPGDSNIMGGEGMSDSVHKEKQSCQPMSPSECQIIVQKNVAAGSGRQMSHQSQRYEQSSMPQPVAKAGLLEKLQTNNETICGSVLPTVVVPPHPDILISVLGQNTGEARRKNDWDVLKSIVYGGLVESITSLSVVSSAAGTDASTLKIVALGLANLVGGFIVIVKDLWELRNARDEATDQNGEPAGRYWEVLGRRENFKMHATLAILSYLLVGIMPPLIYGFSFRESGNTEYKLIAVAAAGLLCISLLAIGKAHVKPRKAYIKCLLSYLGVGVSASGLSYVVGLMITRLLEKLGLFDSNTSATATPSIIYQDISSTVPAWSSY